ncbi:MAG: eukaryotic translation initiation factor 3 subunit F-like [Trebouxia sp. A1-2]|nr:MAG: eukaryotic translation initiation factor 3 subunit F-like [Trebouxia sp. A1-2]
MAPLNLPVGQTSITARVQPVVLFSICDAYIRRNEGKDRVIGTLLGSISDGVVDIRECYAVPHNESMDQVEMDIVHHRTLSDLRRRVNSKERIVGWYACSACLALVFQTHLSELVHLRVDTTLTNNKLDVVAYVARHLTLGDRSTSLAQEFQQVPCEVRTVEVERLGIELLQNEVTEKLPSEAENLQTAIGRLQSALNKASQYVDDVVSGRRKGDINVGRYLADTCAAVPYIRKEDFEQLLQDNTQDALLVMYLANLVRAHVALADKLGTAALPIL